MSSVRMQTRIDLKLKNEAERILKEQGFKPAQAINIFYIEITRKGGFPFLPSEVPNKKLRKALAEAERGIGVKTYKNKKDFFDSLKKL
ncbi:MAG: type II toxin-antitoxin system RelB/DinJ family antitoxin [Candidatus Gracilibacteria bacterium]